ncbi:MAG: HAD family hydrolase [Lentisphaeria bacterium]|nr:HAD family hydrolase [Lentisphaeria bacterium]MBR7146039.1 HAD family hydrolase [Lentisphaeria bacterium]
MLELRCPATQEYRSIEVVNAFKSRQITHVFHDIDGTHSLIRDWVPVMALVNGAVARYGMFEGTVQEIAEAIYRHRSEDFAEARKFAIESAGLSALTQMEWALRMARRLDNSSSELNEKIIEAIWQGKERFENTLETPAEQAQLNLQASKLFKAYEILLLQMSRNKNLADAKNAPGKWQVPGSMDFMEFLHQNGVKNYFVTGAVVEYDEHGHAQGFMAEEVETLGYKIGNGGVIDGFYGSAWDKKEPKNEIMQKLCKTMAVNPENLLIVGDGRSEIAAAVELGAVAISRLDKAALRAREIHRQIGTGLIVEDYSEIKNIFAES